MIPVMLQRKYKPDGWLGALAGNKLFFDISDEQRLEKNFPTFVRELDRVNSPHGDIAAAGKTKY